MSWPTRGSPSSLQSSLRASKPFLTKYYFPFKTYVRFIKEAWKVNTRFGARVHCGESVPLALPDQQGFPAFISHVYTTMIAIDYLYTQLATAAAELPEGGRWVPARSHLRIGWEPT